MIDMQVNISDMPMVSLMLGYSPNQGKICTWISI